jgi:hypothetical protein
MRWTLNSISRRSAPHRRTLLRRAPDRRLSAASRERCCHARQVSSIFRGMLL